MDSTFGDKRVPSEVQKACDTRKLRIGKHEETDTPREEDIPHGEKALFRELRGSKMHSDRETGSQSEQHRQGQQQRETKIATPNHCSQRSQCGGKRPAPAH